VRKEKRGIEGGLRKNDGVWDGVVSGWDYVIPRMGVSLLAVVTRQIWLGWLGRLYHDFLLAGNLFCRYRLFMPVRKSGQMPAQMANRISLRHRQSSECHTDTKADCCV